MCSWHPNQVTLHRVNINLLIMDAIRSDKTKMLMLVKHTSKTARPETGSRMRRGVVIIVPGPAQVHDAHNCTVKSEDIWNFDSVKIVCRNNDYTR